jgi:predicted DNA-binding antitoxin AbrB/MazE fold protein
MTAMPTTTAMFENGVLRPVELLDLRESAMVRLVIERLPKSRVTVGNLNAFLRSLPSLGDDAKQFERDVAAVQSSMQR